MKNILLSMLILSSTVIGYSQSFSYEQYWKKIEKAIEQEKPKTALADLDIVLKQSQKDKSYPNEIRAMLTIIRVRNSYEENETQNSIQQVEAWMKQASSPVKEVLAIAQINNYIAYSNRRRYFVSEFAETTADYTQKKIEEWSEADYKAAIYAMEQIAFANVEVLQKESSANYVSIMSQDSLDKWQQQFYPTLCDVLVHQLIALYQIPPFSFGIQTDEDKQGAVLPAEEFMQANFSSAILRLFQLAMQANKANEEVFAFCDWQRHEYVDEELHEYEFIREKAELLLKQSHSEVLVPMAAAKLASIMIDECNKEDEQLRWRKKEAKDLLKKVIEDHPNSPVLTECQYMLNGIESVSLSAKTEYTVPRNQRSLIRIEHKNIDEVAARLYYLNEDPPTRYYNAEEIHKFCKNKPIAKEWKQSLKNEGDYLEYSTEVVVPALEKAGFYVLEISANDVVSYSIFQVSDLAVVWESDGRVNDQTRFRVLNRVTGLPIADAQVKIFNRNTNKTQTTLHIDKNGRAVWSSSRSYADAISVSYKDDHWIAEDYVSTDSKSAFRPGTNTCFYLDRAIYRPGQKVNFKLYYIQHTNPNVYIANPKQTVKVVLKDANYKQRAEIEVHTNEFGTASGEFVLPNDGLLGTWRICLADGGWGDCVSFRVEEYKRPTFEVQMLPIEGTFKIGENITVKGQAKAYAGNAIDGAKVHYKVVRKENRFSWWWYEPVRDEQITTGETTTDANGDFSITFCAETPVVQSKYKHSYRYVVSVDATDISGETRSAETSVNVSASSVFLGVEVDELLFGKPETNTMHIVTSNAAGNVVPAKVALRIYKTIEPKTIVKKRYWMRPDYVISRELHDNDFPTFEYDHETDPMQWKRGEIVAEKQLTSDGDTVFALDFLPDGFYQYETGTLNDAGEVVSFSGQFRILRMKDAKHAVHIGASTPLLLFAENTTVKAGEKAVFYIGSAAKNAQVFYEIKHADKVLQEGRVTIDNEVITLEQPVDTSLCGEIHIAAYMVLDNRYYNKALTVSVPFDYKNLQVHWQTFRSTLLPGQQEKWTLQITDNAGKVKPTELLASMYDASLDAFAPNKWSMHLYSPIHSRLSFNGLNFGDTHSEIAAPFEEDFFFSIYRLTAPSINFPFGYYGSRRFASARGGGRLLKHSVMANSVVFDSAVLPESAEMEMNFVEEVAATMDLESDESEMPADVRSNFAETAFFYPHLTTDSTGTVNIEFTMPESLTRWHFAALAHTKDFCSALLNEYVSTQKPLMLQPNKPRFVREGDTIILTAKLFNQSDAALSGKATLKLCDAATGKPLAVEVTPQAVNMPFNVEPQRSVVLAWKFCVPNNCTAILYTITATAGQFTDAEENILPVLPNRTLVTEAMHFFTNGEQTKEYTFTHLAKQQSATLQSHKFTVEATANATWLAIQALPYLMEYPYECNEQRCSRMYANALAEKIVKDNPNIKRTFAIWQQMQPEALQSALEKNEELKDLALNETPWLLDGESESASKKRMATLFEQNTVSQNRQKDMKILIRNRHADGGWPWYGESESSTFVTARIVTLIGKLIALGAASDEERHLVDKSIHFLHKRLLKEYNDIKPKDRKDYVSSWFDVQMLYALSFFPNQHPKTDAEAVALNFFMEKMAANWTGNSIGMQTQIALVLHRTGRSSYKKITFDILASLREKALFDEEMGMYWRSNDWGYFRSQGQVQTQTQLIELFHALTPTDTVAIDQMKRFLLKQKQTHHWATTLTTTDAIYALLNSGNAWLKEQPEMTIKVGETAISTNSQKSQVPVTAEAGTGHIKYAWSDAEIKPDMANMTVSTLHSTQPAYGAAYWQYFETMDKIEASNSNSPLSITKQLFVEVATPKGSMLVPVKADSRLQTGQRLVVRLTIRNDRDLEYIHLKDQRAACEEPITNLSGYHYSHGLGYYMEVRDAATNFFFHYLSKGTHVLEYDMRVSQSGTYTAGMATIQSMYAPEFVAHTSGQRLQVE